MTEAELAALRAAAAQAAAEAAEARAAAAAAALEAAEAAAAASAGAPAAPTAAAVPAGPADAVTDPTGEAAPSASSLSEQAAAIQAGYTFQGGTLPLGALVENDEAIAAVQVGLPLAMMNRHGLVAGATGTGKTRTLQAMAEGLSAAGVPVFLADIKGDLSGLVVEGEPNEKLLARTTSLGQDWTPATFPVEFYSLGGQGNGVPIRTTVTDFGPLLLAKVLGLNDTQESSLGLIFHWADTQGLALLDLKDLQSTIGYLTGDDGKDELKGIGGVSAATAGVILREIVALQAQGADVFFGEPAFRTSDLIRTAADGRGVISALELPDVLDRPALFSTFLMWLLADMFGDLPEVGDADKPTLVFFFDEAHLLFNDASKEFLNQVTQTVRLIRSKGVGIFFVTQTPKDVPADVLAQLGNRVQHALRAFTPDDAKALRATARTFPTSEYDLEELLTSLGTGEAVVTVLAEKGAPTPVAWTRLRAPQASMDPAPDATIAAVVDASPALAQYGEPVDNVSAYEMLVRRIDQEKQARQAAEQAEAAAVQAEKDRVAAEKRAAKEAEAAARARAKEDAARAAREAKEAERNARTRRSSLDSLLKSAGTVIGREITRSIFGTRRR
ncbi:helicase HerA-like domain-containing protein [Pseudactinotalea suaedae]|uniref:helicase HerA-like domain-containing protein n=1 Tax=Pseudactinotalea suaedae TaxID=1524924 RepID=UPI0012E302E3|nr:helicase HerA-like domain-containing protein [Pseudactinotalea suaedae]